MAKAVKSKEEATGVASLEPDNGGSVAVQSDAVRYWSPENEKLIVGPKGVDVVKFNDHIALVRRDSDTDKALRKSSSFGVLYFVVEDKTGDEEYQVKLMKFLRNLLEGDEFDQVKTERGYLSVASLFSREELDEMGISRSAPDSDRLLHKAINKKYVEGIV